MKAVFSQPLDQCKLIIVNYDKCSSFSKDVAVKLNESSSYIYRCTVREVGKPSKVEVKRDGELSRKPESEKEANSTKIQETQKSIPMSSKIFDY